MENKVHMPDEQPVNEKSDLRRTPDLHHERIYKFEWIMLVIICMVLFVSHSYNDIIITTRQAVNLWSILFDGKIFDFYLLNENIVSGNLHYTVPQGAAYDFSIYVIFAVWNFPLWLVEKYRSIDIMNSVLCLMWSKALLVVFLYLSTFTIRKICIVLGYAPYKTKWCTYIFLSSAFIFTSLFIMSQYDVIGLFFILNGVLLYLRGSMNKSVVWFALAISFKLFALFVFIPLLLLKEKKIYKLAVYGGFGISFTVALKLIFAVLSTKSSLTTQTSFTSFLTNNGISLSYGNVSLFFIAIVIFYIFCYLKQVNDTSELHKYSIYVSCVAFAIFFVFAYSYPYWIILWVPFIILMIFQNPGKIKENMLIETLLTISMIVAQMITFDWCYGLKTIAPMLLPKLFIEVNDLKRALQVESIDLLGSLPGILNNISLSVFIGSTIVFIVYNHPRYSKNDQTSDIMVDHGMVVSRLLIGGGVALIPIMLYFASII